MIQKAIRHKSLLPLFFDPVADKNWGETAFRSLQIPEPIKFCFHTVGDC